MRAGAVHGLERRSVIAVLAAAGIAGPVLFTVAFIVQGLFRLDEYSPVEEVVSALHAWAGLAQRIVLLVLFPCTVVLALRLRRVARAAGAPG